MLCVICAKSYIQALYAECHYAVCHYAECHYAECHYAECHYAECQGAIKYPLSVTFLLLQFVNGLH
jgi:hypothetical protein